LQEKSAYAALRGPEIIVLRKESLLNTLQEPVYRFERFVEPHEISGIATKLENFTRKIASGCQIRFNSGKHSDSYRRADSALLEWRFLEET